MKYLILFTLPLLLLQACRSQEAFPPSLYNKWMHVYEEDSAGFRAYRPTSLGVRLPPSQGREVYEISANQQFILHSYGPADQPIAHKGRWEKTDENKIQVRFEEDDMAPFSIRIIKLTSDLLYLEKE